jgi:hypothetical protein
MSFLLAGAVGASHQVPWMQVARAACAQVKALVRSILSPAGGDSAASQALSADLVADAAGGAGHRGGQRVSFRQSPISSAANRTCSRQARSAVSPPPSGYLVTPE